MKRILLILSHSPFEKMIGREGQELALAFSAVEHQVHIFYCGQGVLQLHPIETNPELAVKNYPVQQKLFAMYDIEQVFVDSTAFALYQLRSSSLRCNATFIEPNALSLRDYDIVIEV